MLQQWTVHLSQVNNIVLRLQNRYKSIYYILKMSSLQKARYISSQNIKIF